MIWAAAELYDPDFDYPWPLFPSIKSTEAYITGRWWASWMLILALIPIAILYFIWWKLISCSCKTYEEKNDNNVILSETADNRKNSELSDDSHNSQIEFNVILSNHIVS